MKRVIKTLFLVVVCGCFTAVQLTPGQTSRAGRSNRASASQQPPAPNVCAIIPCQVPLPTAPHTPAEARPFFDWFSWESFIAINWPALISNNVVQRGQADLTRSVGDLSVPRVWESWKAEWELFRPASTSNPNAPGTPSAWSSFDLDPNLLPCSNANVNFLQSGGKLLVMSTKMDSVLNQVDEAMAGPLIAQNCTYARYEIRVDESEYNFIKSPPAPNQPLYIYANLPQPGSPNYPVNFASSSTSSPFPLSSCQPSQNPCSYGAIEIKAAWREMKPGEDTSRYYTVNALIVDDSNTAMPCRKATMGLVGLHIAHKVSPFREWVWSTFEQVDNVPPDSGFTPNPGTPPPACSGAPSPFSFNNGYTTPVTTDGWNWPGSPGNQPPTPTVPISTNPSPPVQVSRNTPIVYQNQASPTTQDINKQFQQALSGTVWQNYQLVVTQWPRSSGNFQPFPGGISSYPQSCDLPIPTDVTFSGIPSGEPIMAVANTTMETYFQSTDLGIASCMHCHYLSSGQDFSFMLAREAFKPPSMAALFRAGKGPKNDPVTRLRQFLQQGRTKHQKKFQKTLSQTKRAKTK